MDTMSISEAELRLERFLLLFPVEVSFLHRSAQIRKQFVYGGTWQLASRAEEEEEERGQRG